MDCQLQAQYLLWPKVSIEDGKSSDPSTSQPSDVRRKDSYHGLLANTAFSWFDAFNQGSPLSTL